MLHYRVNNQITEKKIRLVSPDGKIHDVISIERAKQLAQESDLDLVEVSIADNGNLAICKLLDYGKIKYNQSKIDRHQMHQEKTKQIKFRLNISDHDLETKNKKVEECLAHKYKVQYILELKGSQLKHIDLALKKISDNLELFKDKATWTEPKISGKSLSSMLNPILFKF